MPKSSPSSAPSPRINAAEDDSSAGPSSSKRAKYLGASHDLTLANRPVPARAPTPVSSRHARDFDSANFEAARDLLQLRLDAGLSQEALAARTGEDVKTVAQRERGKVDLGALRQRVICERIKKERGPK